MMLKMELGGDKVTMRARGDAPSPCQKKIIPLLGDQEKTRKTKRILHSVFQADWSK